MSEKEMKVLVGLGNPGPEYQNTRHNAGFMVLALMARKYALEIPKKSGSSLIAAAKLEDRKVLLVWPQSYMNNSGPPVRKILDYYKVSPASLLVIHDEMDLPLGRFKLTKGGGDGGHKGIESILREVPLDFARLRVGIGRPDKSNPFRSVINFVLSSFTSLEEQEADKALDTASELACVWVTQGLVKAQGIGHRSDVGQKKIYLTPLEREQEEKEKEERRKKAAEQKAAGKSQAEKSSGPVLKPAD
ncbi:MAG: aminoacyl-tRNA hydrolase [Deltaproteobacteria bacterium]|nr:aminoacyl-tRNA hydrolase [Deltaproteobacteria bacterium]